MTKLETTMNLRDKKYFTFEIITGDTDGFVHVQAGNLQNACYRAIMFVNEAFDVDVGVVKFWHALEPEQRMEHDAYISLVKIDEKDVKAEYRNRIIWDN
jgi:hypothetical protein